MHLFECYLNSERKKMHILFHKLFLNLIFLFLPVQRPPGLGIIFHFIPNNLSSQSKDKAYNQN